jgi:hypothetical protein
MRRRVVAVACVVLSAVSTGCIPRPAAFVGAADAPPLFVHGDSLTFVAESGAALVPADPSITLLTDELAGGGWQASVTAFIGQSAADGRAIVAHWGASGAPVPRAAVVALGSNDLHAVGTVPAGRTDPVTFEEQWTTMDRYLDDLDALGVECIAVLDVATLSSPWGLDELGPSWNALLAAHPHVDHVQGWDAVARAHPEMWEGDEQLVHPDTEDIGRYREQLVAAAEACRR